MYSPINLPYSVNALEPYIDGETNNRIDLVKCSDGMITFVELKRMSDNRMLHETDTTPEVVFQMNRYKQFIEKFIRVFWRLVFYRLCRIAVLISNKLNNQYII